MTLEVEAYPTLPPAEEARKFMKEGPFGIKLDGWDGKPPKLGAGDIAFNCILAVILLALFTLAIVALGCAIHLSPEQVCR
jgi:hypothetical protein